jgi:hypothetical protein
MDLIESSGLPQREAREKTEILNGVKRASDIDGAAPRGRKSGCEGIKY